MAWGLLTAAERSHWLFDGAANDGKEFPYGVRVYETFTDRLKTSWCDSRGIEYRLEYQPKVPAHHIYRFRDEASALSFATQFTSADGLIT